MPGVPNRRFSAAGRIYRMTDRTFKRPFCAAPSGAPPCRRRAGLRSLDM